VKKRALLQQKRNETQEERAKRQLRELAAARPERARKTSELHQKKQAPVKRQHIIGSEENARLPVPPRNLQAENNYPSFIVNLFSISLARCFDIFAGN